MQQRIIDQLILTAGAWRDSGGTDENLNHQFNLQIKEFSRVANVSPQEAVDLLVAELGGTEAVAS